MKHAYLCLLAALAAGTATAQSGSRLDPADPEARVPAATYRSAFDGYRRVEGEARKDWREANDEVRRVGGHLGILREQAAREKPAQAERK
jgi:hypothetical protein